MDKQQLERVDWSVGGYHTSRYNALKYGVELHDLLPSRGPDRCSFRDRCPVAKDVRLRLLCEPGYACPTERVYYSAYVEDARKRYRYAARWLGLIEYEKAIHDLAILTLRRSRQSARIADEGLLREMPSPGDHAPWLAEGLAAGRYVTAIDRAFSDVMRRLLFAPDEEPTF